MSCNPLQDPMNANPNGVSGGLDTTAIHKTTAGEISAMSAASGLDDADVFLIEEAPGFAKKKFTWASIVIVLKGLFDLVYAEIIHTHDETDITDLTHTDTDAIHSNVNSEITGIPSKVTPVDADVLVIEDTESVPPNEKKSLTWVNLLLTAKAYFDTIYSTGGASTWTAWTGAARTDDNTISSTTHLPAGTAVRYKATAGAYEYGVVLSLTSDAHTIMGHPVTTSDNDVFEYDASHSKVHAETIHVAGNFNAADTDTFLSTYDLMAQGWKPSIADEYYLVGCKTICQDDDSSANPDYNPVLFGTTNKIFDTDVVVDNVESNTGTTVDDTNRYYALNFNSALDMSFDKVGAGDAYDADITFIFVKA